MISTRDLSGLPDIPAFRRLTRSLAMLDAVLSPDWESRYYSFDSRWAEGEMMASMRNGSGDHWFALLCKEGVALHGLAHEAPTFRPGVPRSWVFDRLPSEFHRSFLHEPAFDTANSTFCVWRLASDRRWSCGTIAEDDDGSADLLAILDGDPRRYVQFARDYHEVDLARGDVAAIYRHEPLTDQLARRLNRDVDVQALLADIEEIGYPDAG